MTFSPSTRLVHHKEMYKSPYRHNSHSSPMNANCKDMTESPTWRNAYKKRCFDEFKKSRQKLVNRFRNCQIETQNKSKIKDYLEEELEKICLLEAKSEAITVDEALEIYKQIQNELIPQDFDEAQLNDLLKQQEMEEMLNQESITYALSDKNSHVFCPVCQKEFLTQENSFVYCKNVLKNRCNFKISCQETNLDLDKLAERLELALRNHNCNEVPIFQFKTKDQMSRSDLIFVSQLYGSQPVASCFLLICSENLQRAFDIPLEMTNVVDEIRNSQPGFGEKCELVIINPCFNNRFYQTDLISLNSYSTDYLDLVDNAKKISIPQVPLPVKNQILRSSFNDKKSNEDIQARNRKMFPLHFACSLGNVEKIRKFIDKDGCDPQKPDTQGLYPIHYAVISKNVETVNLLIQTYNCNLNTVDSNGMTPLHHAAFLGLPDIIKILVENHDIDLISKNSDGKTPLQLCDNNSQANYKKCAEILKTRLNRPSKQIVVKLMDGSEINLNLISGSNTTAEQLQAQLNNKLGLDLESSSYFSFWIGSKHLKLQLKPDHKPLQQLADWKRCIVPQLTSVDPLKEEPNLLFMRDAMCPLKNEKKINNATAIRLLCFEAYYNYIHSMYISSEQEAAILAVIFMKMINENLKIKDWIQFFKSERKNLRIFVPLKHLFHKTVLDWIKIISNEWERSISQLSSLSQTLQLKFLSICWNFQNYGSALFSAVIPKINHVHVCVNPTGVHFLNKQTRELELFYPIQDLIWKIHYSPDSIEFFSKKNKQSLVVYTKQNNLINYLMYKLEKNQKT
ncbi:unnamed protein product [Brachionus calyciflorus]|uniref:FERM domain-containing protein n=1 Tax=Brachionus calyciflorus TaxID=104777 RepID=A0A813LVF6_9BILA|nr:unnamed protein product [Brachionus calyciflorus]